MAPYLGTDRPSHIMPNGMATTILYPDYLYVRASLLLGNPVVIPLLSDSNLVL